MSSIEDLKNNANRAENIGSNKHKNKPVLVAPKEESSNRIEVDLTKVCEPEEPDPNIHESPIKDILEGENSPFQKYIDNKTAEMEERMALYDQEKSLDSEEELSEDDNIGTDNNISFVEDEDLFSDIEEDEDDNDEEIVNVIDDLDVDEEIESASDEPEEEIIKKEQPKEVEEVKEEEIPTPDIDLDVENVESKNEILVFDEEDEQEKEDDNDAILEHLRKIATEKLKPAAKSLDISSFTIMKKPTANIKSLEFAQVKAAKWVLMNQETTVQMKEFSGSEIEELREASEDSNSLTQLYRRFKILYDHIVSPKPMNYEAWLKSTPYSDVEHYFFCAYISSFKGSNYIPMDCDNTKCGKTYLTDDIPIMDMVKFDNKESSDKFSKLYKSEKMTSSKGLYISEIVPLSNSVAIGFKEPSIYSAFEIASLTQADKNKYGSIIDYIPYIDALYLIHQDTNSLEPIGYKIYPDNASKTIKSKIKIFDAVLKTLTVDEFAIISSFIREITKKIDGMTYQYPAVECPYCKTTSKAMPVLPSQALFTRAQIGALVNTSLN